MKKNAVMIIIGIIVLVMIMQQDNFKKEGTEWCEDHDGSGRDPLSPLGYNSIFTKSYTFDWLAPTTPSWDICLSDTVIRERYCSSPGAAATYRDIDCPIICFDGACVGSIPPCATSMQSCGLVDCCSGLSCVEQYGTGADICITSSNRLYAFCTDCTTASCYANSDNVCVTTSLMSIAPSSPNPCQMAGKSLHAQSQFYQSTTEVEAAMATACAPKKSLNETCSTNDECNSGFCLTVCVQNPTDCSLCTAWGNWSGNSCGTRYRSCPYKSTCSTIDVVACESGGGGGGGGGGTGDGETTQPIENVTTEDIECMDNDDCIQFVQECKNNKCKISPLVFIGGMIFAVLLLFRSM